MPEINDIWDDEEDFKRYSVGTGEALKYFSPEPQKDHAPTSNLPDWTDCRLRVSNSNHIEQDGYGPEPDGHYANDLHKFIYEYDCHDDYKSAWWRHRLEKLIDFVKSEAVDEYIKQHEKQESQS